jgi:hypothetical protein
MNRNPDPPALTPEDRENLHTMRLIHRRHMEEERLARQIKRLLDDLETRINLSTTSVGGQ